jgi:S1-C subfamily serine protease
MQDAVFQETPQLVEYTSGRLRFDKVTLEAELREPRLAILRVRAPLGTVVPEPVRLTQTCDIQPGTKIYAIGWPFTPSRTVPSKGTGRPELDLKRWSEGVYVGHLKLKNEAYPYFATTNDSLTGLSGGPLLTEQGIVMSIAQKGATASGNAYTGNDDTKEWHTLGSHCEFTKAIGQNM